MAKGNKAATKRRADESDDDLLERVQRQTFRYFWEFAHPVSGLARERSNHAFGYGPEVVTTGGSGMGIMAIVIAVERGWTRRKDAVQRLRTIAEFLLKAPCYHGVMPHFMDGASGRTIPFTRKDDGADLIETAYLMAGLLTAREYFDKANTAEEELRLRITWLWEDIEWNWHTQGGRDELYWHWSPNNGWSMNLPIRGWNECLIVYVLAAASPRFAISSEVYRRGWTASPTFRNGRSYHGHELPLGPDYGGSLFFAHYSFMGLDPHGLVDRYGDYWAQNLAHVAINRAHCLANPGGFKGYGEDCWGLTASDSVSGYSAHAPDNDLGVISPTAALGSFPYAPDASMQALRHFMTVMDGKVWGEFGFRDAFSETAGWIAESHLAIDQGPVVVMIENYRTGLIWKLFMACPEVRTGLRRLGFTSPHLADLTS